MVNDERVKLRTMLDCWIEHNKEHSQEFRQWAEKAKAFEETEVYDGILQAAQEVDRANQSLSRALKGLEGKGL